MSHEWMAFLIGIMSLVASNEMAKSYHLAEYKGSKWGMVINAIGAVLCAIMATLLIGYWLFSLAPA